MQCMYTTCTNVSSVAQTGMYKPDQPSIIRAETAEHRDQSQTVYTVVLHMGYWYFLAYYYLNTTES